MTRAVHKDLLEQARRLATLDVRKPKQANLRRAISATYYAMFHLLVDEACRVLIGAQHNQSPFRQVLGRAFTHGAMKEACKSFGGGTLKKGVAKGLPVGFTIPGEIRRLADTFVDLQDSSALVKRYVQETGTVWVRRLTRHNPSITIYIARITVVEDRCGGGIDRIFRHMGGDIPRLNARAVRTAEAIAERRHDHQGLVEDVVQPRVLDDLADQGAGGVLLVVRPASPVADDLHRALEGASALGQAVVVLALPEISEGPEKLYIHRCEYFVAKKRKRRTYGPLVGNFVIAADHLGPGYENTSATGGKTTKIWVFFGPYGGRYFIGKVIDTEELIGVIYYLFFLDSHGRMRLENVFDEIEHVLIMAIYEKISSILKPSFDTITFCKMRSPNEIA
jgi:hypothetical protein